MNKDSTARHSVIAILIGDILRSILTLLESITQYWLFVGRCYLWCCTEWTYHQLIKSYFCRNFNYFQKTFVKVIQGLATFTKYFTISKYLVPGGYSKWSAWGECTVSCGGGEMTRTRSCTNPVPEHGGPSCIERTLGPSVETSRCREFPCPGR